MKGRSRRLPSRSFAAGLGWVACCCALAFAAQSCRSTQESDPAPELGAGWQYERSGEWHWIQGQDLVQSAGEHHYALALYGRSLVWRASEVEPSPDSGAGANWECFLVVVGPFGRTEPPVEPPMLELGGGSADVAGALVATFYAPRFDFALPPGLLATCAEPGVSWTLRDGAIQLGVSLSGDYVRGFLTALNWADQVGALEEQARPASYRSLPEAQ